ncbi:MAG: MBL fold metallo-hydrolase [Clostridia bacterium]|nr:MBL fold metallo-hydrolase [Clostridia bacterium]
MKMKRIIAILLPALLLLAAACGGNPAPAAPESAPEQTYPPETQSAAESSAPQTHKPQQPQESTEEESMPQEQSEPSVNVKLLYMGQSSVRITTPEGRVIYVDPYAGDGYAPAADLILITHGHYDHNRADLVANRNPECAIITWAEALEGGEHRTFDLGFVTVEAVEAGNNPNHSIYSCVGYLLTFTNGVSVYFSGDTSKTQQMAQLAEKQIDYAFFCCDGVYNMDTDEAAECARLVGAKHNIPYHVIAQSGKYFDLSRAELFNAPNRLIINEGEETELVKG